MHHTQVLLSAQHTLKVLWPFPFGYHLVFHLWLFSPWYKTDNPLILYVSCLKFLLNIQQRTILRDTTTTQGINDLEFSQLPREVQHRWILKVVKIVFRSQSSQVIGYFLSYEQPSKIFRWSPILSVSAEKCNHERHTKEEFHHQPSMPETFP